MTTTPLTLHLESSAARAFAEAPQEDRRKIEILLSLRLKELVSTRKRSLQEVLDNLATEAEARGLTPEILQSILNDDQAEIRG